jgi:hypothetical protein
VEFSDEQGLCKWRARRDSIAKRRRTWTWFSPLPFWPLDLLFRFLRQNKGVLSKRAREREFAKLTDDEVVKIEASYAGAFATR